MAIKTKKLYLLRHAEARRPEAHLKDIERGLTSKGIQDASRIGAWLYKNNEEVNVIFHSSAERARLTSELVNDYIKLQDNLVINDENLYEASVRIYYNMVQGFKDEWNSAMIIGHNPVITYFLEHVSNEDVGSLEPGQLAILSLNVNDWKAVTAHVASLLNVVTPDLIS